jgi:hypothetical protein
MFLWLCLRYWILVYEWSTYRYWARYFPASRNAVSSRLSMGSYCMFQAARLQTKRACAARMMVFLHIPSSGDNCAPFADSRHFLAVSAACLRCACSIHVARHICVASACIGSTHIGVANVKGQAGLIGEGRLLSQSTFLSAFSTGSLDHRRVAVVKECYSLTSSSAKRRPVFPEYL